MLDNFIILALIVLSFISGLKVSEHYHKKAAADMKEALEKQFLRLKARADADDPCKPYGTPQVYTPIKQLFSTGDYDGDNPLNEEFINKLKDKGKATVKLNRQQMSK